MTCFIVILACLAVACFYVLSHERHDFRDKIIETEITYFNFLCKFYQKYFSLYEKLSAMLQGDQKVSVYLMITVQKHAKYFKQFQSLTMIT
jgi:hypothetical protein